MTKIVENSPFLGPPLDKLGQLPTDSLKNLKKRARSKWYSRAIVGRLLYLDTPLRSYYNRAFHCADILVQQGKKITTKYCDSRVCHICNRIRTAKLMKGYITQLLELGDLQFITLTIPNCRVDQTRAVVDDILKKWSHIIRVLRERRKIDLSGIRKLEITYNSTVDTFHPHLHILANKSVGELIVDEWLHRYPNAIRKAQDITPADSKSLNELFKYTTKIIGNKKGKLEVYIKPLDEIMKAMSGRRCFQPFGIIKKVDEDVTGLESVEYEGIPEYDLLSWEWDDCDWKCKGHGTLTGYIPPDAEFVFYE